MHQRPAAPARDQFALHDDAVAGRDWDARRKRDVVDDLKRDAVVAAHAEGFVHRVRPGAVEEVRRPGNGRAEAHLARDVEG